MATETIEKVEKTETVNPFGTVDKVEKTETVKKVEPLDFKQRLANARAHEAGTGKIHGPHLFDMLEELFRGHNSHTEDTTTITEAPRVAPVAFKPEPVVTPMIAVVPDATLVPAKVETAKV